MKKNVIGIDVSKLTIDAYVKIAQVHAEFSNDTKGFRQLVKWIKRYTDFKMMGQTAAQMILNKEKGKVKNPFNFIDRESI
ncbi:MAG TPA: hypothetical protein DIS65_08115 [Candidatus Marinimicrobia bacterium]|nr:hypothetical protein [Candidatus Neomarinimicrobiota bacterium]|tara:strand:+ start:1784 stop:2023 length:240 start_codon:yes stop_codon:yes gene_type:complete